MPYLLTANPSSPTSWVKMDTESVLSGHSEFSQRSRRALPPISKNPYANYAIPPGHGNGMNGMGTLPNMSHGGLNHHGSTPPMMSPTSVLSNYSLNRNINHLNLNLMPRTNSVMSNTNHYGRLESPYQTTVSMPLQDREPQSERIEVQILPQDNDWGDNTTAVTGLSDLAFPPDSMGKWPQQDDEDEGGWKFACQRYAGGWTAMALSVLAFLSPIVMVALPQMDVLGLRDSQLRCEVECDGLLISFSFRLTILFFGSWALFFRHPKATMPRIYLYRACVCVLIFIFVFAFWLFYGVKVLAEQRRRVQYTEIVAYASSMVDALLFLHYLAIILIEVRHLSPQFYIKVVRSPDGESRNFAIGQLSIQRAAAWVLEKYYTDFSVFNPYLERLPASRGCKRSPPANFKYYDVDGLGAIQEKDNRVGSPRKRDSSHNERFYEEYEYERRLKKRKARLVTATEDAFAHIKRLNQEAQKVPSVPLEAYEAAQAIFPSIAKPLQKYLRITRQQPRHTMDSILQHLATCLKYDMAPKAFLERFLVTSPVLQNDREHRPVQTWALICDVLLSRSIKPGTVFQLRQGDVSLLCEVHSLPHFNITEEIIDPKSNKFLLRINSETPV